MDKSSILLLLLCCHYQYHYYHVFITTITIVICNGTNYQRLKYRFYFISKSIHDCLPLPQLILLHFKPVGKWEPFLDNAFFNKDKVFLILWFSEPDETREGEIHITSSSSIYKNALLVHQKRKKTFEDMQTFQKFPNVKLFRSAAKRSQGPERARDAKLLISKRSLADVAQVTEYCYSVAEKWSDYLEIGGHLLGVGVAAFGSSEGDTANSRWKNIWKYHPMFYYHYSR